jgi:hypothetical protein
MTDLQRKSPGGSRPLGRSNASAQVAKTTFFAAGNASRRSEKSAVGDFFPKK